MCRPELSYEMLAEIDQNRKPLPAEVIEQVEIEIKYEGYIERQKRQVDQYKKMEKHKIPNWMDYDEVPSLRLEARQKLKAFRPGIGWTGFQDFRRFPGRYFRAFGIFGA